ncbi:hypothetical protein D3C72_2163520 [compost metagenome]
MKMNIGSVSSAYHFISFMLAEKPSSKPPLPHRSAAAMTPTTPMAANTRWPVSIDIIIDENIKRAIIS